MKRTLLAIVTAALLAWVSANAAITPTYFQIVNAAAVTPSDSVDLGAVAKALFIGGSGAVSVDISGGNTAVVFSGLTAGTILPVKAKRVRSTGTTATLILALY